MSNRFHDPHPDQHPKIRQILRFLHKNWGWRLEYSSAHPDYKRPSVSRGTESYGSEYAAYAGAVEKLEDEHCLMQEGMGDHLEGNELKHWENWNSEFKVRHTLESAKALVEMANKGRFDSIIFSDGYMDEPSFSLKLSLEPFVFMIAENVGVNDAPWLAFTQSPAEVLSLLKQVDQDSPFTWSITSLSQHGATRYGEEDPDEDDLSEDEDDGDDDNAIMTSPNTHLPDPQSR